jgi:hypothetical protein
LCCAECNSAIVIPGLDVRWLEDLYNRASRISVRAGGAVVDKECCSGRDPLRYIDLTNIGYNLAGGGISTCGNLVCITAVGNIDGPVREN